MRPSLQYSQLRDIESDKIRERYKIEKKQVEEEEEESEDEGDSFGTKKTKEEETDDPVAREWRVLLDWYSWIGLREGPPSIFLLFTVPLIFY
jgi:hypothetical protein